MDQLLELITDKETGTTSLGPASLKNLGHCLAYLFVDDFTTKIFPSSCAYNNQSNLDELRKAMEKSLTNPFFKLCEVAFRGETLSSNSTALTLLVNIYKHFEATGFLILYYLRGMYLIFRQDSF